MEIPALTTEAITASFTRNLRSFGGGLPGLVIKMPLTEEAMPSSIVLEEMDLVATRDQYIGPQLVRRKGEKMVYLALSDGSNSISCSTLMHARYFDINDNELEVDKSTLGALIKALLGKSLTVQAKREDPNDFKVVNGVRTPKIYFDITVA